MATKRSVPSGRVARYAILIAGLSRDAREMYQEFFVWAGWRVILAAESTAAFELVAAEQPDIVATSDRLRPRSGLQLCEQLQADARTAHIPVMILTTATTTLDRERALTAGCATLLIQPTLPRLLLTEAGRLIARMRRAKEREEGAESPAAFRKPVRTKQTESLGGWTGLRKSFRGM